MLAKIKQQIKKKQHLIKQFEERGRMFVNYGFKTQEQQDNYYIRPLVSLIKQGTNQKPTVTQGDLWSNTNQARYLKDYDFSSDKMTLLKLAKLQKRKTGPVETKVKPFFMTRKEELVLLNKIYAEQQFKNTSFQQDRHLQFGANER